MKPVSLSSIIITSKETREQGTAASVAPKSAISVKPVIYPQIKPHKSSRNFYQDFRDGINLVNRYMSKHSSLEEHIKVQEQQKLKVKRLRSERSQLASNRDNRLRAIRSSRNIYRSNDLRISSPVLYSPPRPLGTHKKHPASLNKMQFNLEIIPEHSQSKVSLDQLKSFIFYQSHYSKRFN